MDEVKWSNMRAHRDLDYSCVLNRGSPSQRLSEEEECWMEVEAQAFDCGPRVTLCDFSEVHREPSLANDAIVGHLNVNLAESTPAVASSSGVHDAITSCASSSRRIDFVFSVTLGGFTSFTNVMDADRRQEQQQQVFESMVSFLSNTVDGFSDAIMRDVQCKLELATTTSEDQQ